MIDPVEWPHGFQPRRSRKNAAASGFSVEGPWNIGDPVHELVTERALRQADIIKDADVFSGPAAWEIVRGVIWNDDPEGMLFDNNDEQTQNWSNGLTYLTRFNAHKKSAKKGAFFGPGTPLLARSHFGDLQCLHAMASRDGEQPEETLRTILEWAEFLYLVSIGSISDELPIGAITQGRMHLWFPASNRSVRSTLLVGKRGSARHRALGALLHIIEDSFSKGHAERNDRWELVEFHAYVGQDGDRHAADDKLRDGGIDAMPEALRAADACADVARCWKRARPWSTVRSLLEDSVFRLSADARPASAGASYRAGLAAPAGFAAPVEAAVSCNYQVEGTIRDDDWPDRSEVEPYGWGEPFSIVPGGAPVVFHHQKIVDDEVELRAILFFSMTADRRLHASGELSLYEGNAGGRHLKDSETFGPLAVERGTFADLLETKLTTGEGGWAAVRLGVANEGE